MLNKIKKFGLMKTTTTLLGVGLFASIIWFIYRKPLEETSCRDIPEGSVVFAPAFLNLGEKNGVFIPGKANIQIAEKLEECAGRFSLVLTQKSVSDALDNPDALRDGTPVLQMHDHDPKIEVRTFVAFKCALERFERKPDRIVLIVQPKHHTRALMDLKALYRGEITNLYLGDVFYEDDHWSRPLRWTWKNLLGWLGDYLLVLSIKYPIIAKLGPILEKFDVTIDCPVCVQLPKISEKN